MPEPTLQNVSAGFAVDAIVAVVLTTANASYLLRTGTEADYKAAVEAGEEKALRKLNQILALHKTQDLPKGYDVTLTDVLMTPEVYALVDGGVNTMASSAFSKYQAPAVGNPVSRTPFTLEVYAEYVGTDGEADGYLKFSTPKCTGKPVDFTLRDGDFWAPKYTIQSRPDNGESPLTIDKVTTLPTVANG